MTEEDSSAQQFMPPAADPSLIGFHNAVFAWDNSASDSSSTSGLATPIPSTPSTLASTSSAQQQRKFRLRLPGDLNFKPSTLNLVLGPTGSGKTSILLALLGEMHFIPTGPDSWYNLPREGGVAYAAQSPWVLSRTIKVIILTICRRRRQTISTFSGEYSVRRGVRC